MAVTVKIDDKKKKAKAQNDGSPPVKAAGLEDYILPQEKQEGLKALGFWLAIMAVLCLPCWLWEETHPWATGMTTWGFLASVGYLIVYPQIVLRRLRASGDEFEITDKTNARVHTLMKKASGILDIKVPDGYLEVEGDPKIYALPQAVVIRKGATAFLEPDEVNCLVVRCLVHLRERQARRLALIQLVESTPPLVRLLVWPAWIYARLLRNLWYPQAQKNADRIALLLIKNTKLLLSAIVKEYAATDANMQELNVETQDVTNWVNQAGHIGMAGEEISTQYKLGRAIHEDFELEERLQAVQKWGESAEFKTAVQKLSESLRRPAVA